MSEMTHNFVPGFASRHRAAAHVLQKAFSDGEGFAASEVSRIGRRETDGPVAPKHFTPANPGMNPTEGWDPLTNEVAEPEVHASGPFVDPIAAAHAAGVAEGRAAALQELEDVKAREAALLTQVSEALAQGAHFDRERMAGHLRQTVLHLVSKLVGEVGVAPDVLTGRIKAAVDMLADNAESALLRLHPDDVALVEGKLPAHLFAAGDPNVARGGFVIESASTIIEDGPDLWLEQLATAIDSIPIPPAC